MQTSLSYSGGSNGRFTVGRVQTDGLTLDHGRHGLEVTVAAVFTVEHFTQTRVKNLLDYDGSGHRGNDAVSARSPASWASVQNIEDSGDLWLSEHTVPLKI